MATTDERAWQVLLRHAGCLLLPLLTLVFVATGPHAWPLALAVLTIPPLIAILDLRTGPARSTLRPAGPRWAFSTLIAILVAIQFITVGLLVRLAAHHGLSFGLVAAVLIVGVNSGWGTFVVAHELIHRPERFVQSVGRLLLSTVFYEHFFTEHVRGHHRHVATPEDPATARLGESLRAFQVRTIPAQWKSAWNIERERLGDKNMGPWDPRQLGNRVLQGVVLELAFLTTIFVFFGWLAAVVLVWQAVIAIDLLETVNYFEHWGLQRNTRRVQHRDSWDAESWFSLYTLVGLARHADHHAYAAKPFYRLEPVDESPKLPHGYYGMVMLAQVRNRYFRSLMTRALTRHQLGAPPREPGGNQVQ
jgi:alkane 1-monooxygenase